MPELNGQQFKSVAEIGKMGSEHGGTMNRLASRGIPGDIRYSRGDMKDFTAHVKEVGVHTPISLVQDDKGRDMVADGHHRFVAAKRAGLTHLPVEYL